MTRNKTRHFSNVMADQIGPALLALSFCIIPSLAHAGKSNTAVTIGIDASANRHAISPYIYGTAYATSTQLLDLNFTLNRYGGNNTSRYNWQVNGDNRGADWYFESIADSSATAGERIDTFITSSKAGHAEPMITIPMIDYIAKLGANRSKLPSFSQIKYGAQTGNDSQWFSDAGNGILKSNGSNIVNDPTDANVPNSSSYQMGLVNHLISTWGSASATGLKYYILDNEPSIWHSTHRDVHPTGATMAEVSQKLIDYAAKIKAADPSALIVGPEEWGWSGYFFSGYDQQAGAANGWTSYPDKVSHGNADYLPWLLSQFKTYDQVHSIHLLDVFSVHWYPQGGEFSNTVTTTMQQLRNRSTRSLWDPNYIDQSWINAKVNLIPRLKSWVSTNYRVIPVGITEYNWGAEGTMNGATAQADLLGIFAREGLDFATRWTTPAATSPTYQAMKLYRNYDGAKSSYGDISVATNVPNPDNLTAFSAVRSSDNSLTVMVVSKVLSGSTPVTLSLSNFTAGTSASVWQVASSTAIKKLNSIAISGSKLSASVPAQSVTLFVIPAK